MKEIQTRLIVFILILLSVSCSNDDGPTRNEVSIIPASFLDRDNDNLGTVEISGRDVVISVWDHGTVDGDIVSIYVNGTELIANRVLEGPSSKYAVSTTLEYEGYNYVLLYAHNEGSISPNTASMSIDDGTNLREFILEANLLTNGAVDLVVN